MSAIRLNGTDHTLMCGQVAATPYASEVVYVRTNVNELPVRISQSSELHAVPVLTLRPTVYLASAEDVHTAAKLSLVEHSED